MSYERDEQMLGKFAVTIGTIALLLWLWPNLVHEPLHALALQLQGADYHIDFDFGWPPRPTITHLGGVGSAAGGLFFLLLPSLFSVALLFVLFLLARGQRVSVISHIALPAYLAFDITVNILKWRLPTSDFFFLIAVPFPDILAIAVALLTGGLAASTMLRAAPTTIYNRTAQPSVSGEK